MNFIKIIIIIIFFPIKIIYLILKFFFDKLNRARLKNIIKNISIEKIDSLSGIDFEKYVFDLFYAYGYKVQNTKASGDNGVDVFAYKHKTHIAIQAKMYYNHSVGNKAVQEVLSAKNYYKCDKAVVITNSNFSASAIDTANTLGIILISRAELIKITKFGFDDFRYSLDKYIFNYL